MSALYIGYNPGKAIAIFSKVKPVTSLVTDKQADKQTSKQTNYRNPRAHARRALKIAHTSFPALSASHQYI